MFTALRPYMPTAVFALLIFYFGCQALTGDRGLLTRPQRVAALSRRIQAFKRLQAEDAALQSRVRLLRDRSISKDLLEERARALLGFADPRDYVVRISRP